MLISSKTQRLKDRLNVSVFVAFSTVLLAGEAPAEIVVLEIPLAMTCPMSEPPLFKELFLTVAGAQTVDISYEDQTAIVNYEDTEASPDDFMNALRDFLPTISAEQNGMEQDEEGMEGM